MMRTQGLLTESRRSAQKARLIGLEFESAFKTEFAVELQHEVEPRFGFDFEFDSEFDFESDFVESNFVEFDLGLAFEAKFEFDLEFKVPRPAHIDSQRCHRLNQKNRCNPKSDPQMTIFLHIRFFFSPHSGGHLIRYEKTSRRHHKRAISTHSQTVHQRKRGGKGRTPPCALSRPSPASAVPSQEAPRVGKRFSR